MRESFMPSMKERGIRTSIHYPPIHRFEAYASIPRAELPLTEDVASWEVTLPLFPTMTEEQMEMIRNAVVSFGHTPRY